MALIQTRLKGNPVRWADVVAGEASETQLSLARLSQELAKMSATE